MAVQFRPDVVSAGTELDTLTRKSKSPRSHSPGEKAGGTVTARYSRTEVYGARGNLRLSAEESGTLLDAYLETKKAIQEQLARFLGSHTTGAPKMGEDEAVVPDGIPEYWNQENTARRIFAIALMGYQEGSDRGEFMAKAIAMVKQAYSDVGSALGFELPQLVTGTRQAVLDALEQFRGGAALSEISFD